MKNLIFVELSRSVTGSTNREKNGLLARFQPAGIDFYKRICRKDPGFFFFASNAELKVERTRGARQHLKRKKKKIGALEMIIAALLKVHVSHLRNVQTLDLLLKWYIFIST